MAIGVAATARISSCSWRRERDTRAGILDRVNDITPTGKTPLTGAIEQAATTLSYTDSPATVVLISGGLESCERDPCAVSEALEQGGVGFTAHVVGFDYELRFLDVTTQTVLARKVIKVE